MTNRYVRSGGNAGTWTGTVATLTAGLAAPTVAGDDIYIAADHSEPVAGAAITYTALGTTTAPNRIFVASHTGSFPPVAADLIHTPTVTLSTNAATANITTAGVVSWCEGIIFSSGTGSVQANVHFGGFWQLENCSVIVNNTSVSSAIRPTAAATNKTVWNNVTVQFGAIQQALQQQGAEFIWKNTPNAIAGTIPTNLFGNGSSGTATLRGVDLSALTPSKTLCAAGTGTFIVYLMGCKEPASWTLTGAQTGDFITVIRERSENTGLNYTKGKDDHFGTQTVDASVIRTGGASDGTTTTSWKIDTATKARAKPERPFKSLPMVIWNDVTGTARTITVFGNGASVPTNADIWVEVEYLGSAGSPVHTIVSSKIATPLTTPSTAGVADSSPWTGGTTAFKLVVILNGSGTNPFPAMKGSMTIRVCVGAQGTYYIDWQPVLS